MMRSLTASIDTKPSVPAGQGLDERGSRVGIIYQSVLNAVVEHRLPPGAKLTKEQLGTIFGASRTTVRSALQALAHDHIVTLALIAAPSFRPRRSKPRGISSPRASSSRPRSLGKPRRIDAAQLAELRALLSTERAALNRSDRPAAPVIRSLSHRRRGDVRRRRSYRLPEKLDLAILAGG